MDDRRGKVRAGQSGLRVVTIDGKASATNSRGQATLCVEGNNGNSRTVSKLDCAKSEIKGIKGTDKEGMEVGVFVSKAYIPISNMEAGVDVEDPVNVLKAESGNRP